MLQTENKNNRQGGLGMTTPMHCPGFDALKGLKSFECECPNCGHVKEIFSDEFDKKHVCPNCKQEIDFTKCKIIGPPTKS